MIDQFVWKKYDPINGVLYLHYVLLLPAVGSLVPRVVVHSIARDLFAPEEFQTYRPNIKAQKRKLIFQGQALETVKGCANCAIME